MWISKGIDDESFYYLFDGNGNEFQFQILGDKIIHDCYISQAYKSHISKMTGINFHNIKRL